MHYPKKWPRALKKTVSQAYETKKLNDVRIALKKTDEQVRNEHEQIVNIGILRTFTIETLLECLRLSLTTIPCNPNITLGEIENIEQELFNKESIFLKSSPDFIYILWRLEELLPNLMWNIDSMSLEQRRDSFDMLVDRIKQIVTQYKGSAPLIISTFSVPDYWKSSLHDKHRSYGIVEIVSRLNLFLYEQASFGSIKIFDMAQWLSSVGELAVNKKMDFYARQPIAARYALSFADFFSQVVRTLLTTKSKVLAIDLDNTLWGGVLGEDGIENLNIGKDYPANVYWRIQQVVYALKSRGIVLVLLSKNNITDVTMAFDSLSMPLKLSDFSVVKANWKSKYANLIDASEELSLGIDSFVFLDDQLFEQEEMNAFLPSVEVISNSGDPLNLLESLSDNYFFDSFLIGQEDLVRNEDYKNQVSRKNLENELDRETFLTSLDLKANIDSVNDANLNRVMQMISKTNQFNLTTKRHSISSVKKLMSIKDNILLTISLCDKFGDQGIIGLCIAINSSKPKKELIIDTFLLSCRALGRDAEDALWCGLIRHSNNMGYEFLRASYLASSKNMQVAGFYNRMGMSPEANKDEKNIQYTLNLPQQENCPEWIDIRFMEIINEQ